MAYLETFHRKFGKKLGRKKYNEYHREYRRKNHAKMIQYWRDRRKAEKDKQNGASTPFLHMPHLST